MLLVSPRNTILFQEASLWGLGDADLPGRVDPRPDCPAPRSFSCRRPPARVQPANVGSVPAMKSVVHSLGAVSSLSGFTRLCKLH